MNVCKRWSFLLLLAVCWSPAGPACAQSDAGETAGPRRGLSVGARGSYYRAKGNNQGDLAQGAQVRLHFTPAWALEGAVDFLQNDTGDTKVDVIPVQCSLMVYILPPGYRVAPYLSAGGGWYYSRGNESSDRFKSRFGPHLGAGVEWFVTHSWSLDATFRQLWREDAHSQDREHPLGQNFRDNGFMLSLALNYGF